MDRTELADRVDARPVDLVRPAEAEFVNYGRPAGTARRWEYLRLDRSGTSQLLSEEQLNALGIDGWELASVVSDFSGTHYFLKRSRTV